MSDRSFRSEAMPVVIAAVIVHVAVCVLFSVFIAAAPVPWLMKALAGVGLVAFLILLFCWVRELWDLLTAPPGHWTRERR